MKIIFLKDHQQGKKGQIKEVSSGFAQNFLIPKGFAQVATLEIQAKIAKEAREAQAKHQKDLARLQALKSELEKRIFRVEVKVGNKGQIFSGVHDKDIALAVNQKLNIDINRQQVELSKPIKALGEYQVKINLGEHVIASAKIRIEAEA